MMGCVTCPENLFGYGTHHHVLLVLVWQHG